MSPEIAAFREILDRAVASGRRIELWWRDDDAVDATPALDRLLGLARQASWPIGLAAIPADARPALRDRLADEPLAHRVLIHGLRHRDHAGGGKRAELGAHRPLASLATDAAEGLALTAELFGPRALPVLVPPWNRVAPDLAAALPRLGYKGLSTFGSPGRDPGPPIRCDTHLDPVDWRGSRSLLPAETLAGQLRRAVAGSGPVGLLTHHLMFDEALWSFASELVGLLHALPEIRLAGPGAVFGEAGRDGSNRARGRHVNDGPGVRPAFA